MSKYFNNLSPAELERLSFLVEEMGEASQALGKILRHGFDTKSPYEATQITNRDDLARELGHVFCAMEMLVKSHDISYIDLHNSCLAKRSSVKEWMHHN